MTDDLVDIEVREEWEEWEELEELEEFEELEESEEWEERDSSESDISFVFRRILGDRLYASDVSFPPDTADYLAKKRE